MFTSGLQKAVSEYEEIPAGTEKPVRLKVSVAALKLYSNEKFAFGTFLYDDPIVINHRDGSKAVDVQTFDVRFGLVEGGSVHLVIFHNQTGAPYVRARISPLLVQRTTRASSVQITEAKMDSYLGSHPHELRSTGFVGLTLPHVSKSRITGSDLEQASDYHRYKTHGRSNSWFFTHLRRGWTISVNKDGGVTIWRDVDPMEALRFIRDEILPLCS